MGIGRNMSRFLCLPRSCDAIAPVEEEMDQALMKLTEAEKERVLQCVQDTLHGVKTKHRKKRENVLTNALLGQEAKVQTLIKTNRHRTLELESALAEVLNKLTAKVELTQSLEVEVEEAWRRCKVEAQARKDQSEEVAEQRFRIEELEETLEAEKQGGAVECPVCTEDILSPRPQPHDDEQGACHAVQERETAVLGCGHRLHLMCLIQCVNPAARSFVGAGQRHTHCPICRCHMSVAVAGMGAR